MFPVHFVAAELHLISALPVYILKISRAPALP